MMILIEANDDVAELNRVISELVAVGQIREDKYGGILKIGDLIYHNSVFYEENNDEAFSRFYAIISNAALSVEERCDLILGI